MVRCIDFYRKWEEEPNWCNKCPEAVRLINNYIELVDILEKRGVPRETTMVVLSERAIRPLFKEKDEELRRILIQKVENALKRKTPHGGQFYKRLKASDIKEMIHKEKIDKVLPKCKIDKTHKNCTLYNGDFQEICKKIPENSINAIITDPPYPIEFKLLWKELPMVAKRILKPSGFLISYVGQLYLDDIFKWFSDSGLLYYWQCVLVSTHENLTRQVHARRIISGHRPVIIYQKSPMNLANVIHDTYFRKIESYDKTLHPWQQPEDEIDVFVENFTQEGDTILDPFLGPGTFGVSPLKHKRNFIGIELNTETFSIAERRLSQFNEE